MVGGKIDILLGIQYLSHFPKLVHSLDNGLSIFKVQLTPSSPEVTVAIAGPHHSFNLILEQVGDVVTMITAFKRGIDRWNASGPPSLNHLPLAMRDMQLTTTSETPSKEGTHVGLSALSNTSDAAPLCEPETHAGLPLKAVTPEITEFYCTYIHLSGTILPRSLATISLELRVRLYYVFRNAWPERISRIVRLGTPPSHHPAVCLAWGDSPCPGSMLRPLPCPPAAHNL
jgi:hypothetical protein